MDAIRKYPRTRHVEGSGLQEDDDPNVAPAKDLAQRFTGDDNGWVPAFAGMTERRFEPTVGAYHG